ncbi:MAG: ElaB/YqjD/DUF883 family membrane-anchored ribosome-binding protein [Pseudophaeobacter arcticus]|jgi:ElaB/YqjD/DUF883 family membrane-anchored ribosome-binding protein
MGFLMSQNSKATTEAATDFEAVSHQLAALRTDLSRLAETVSGIAGKRGSHMATDIVEGFGEAKHYVERTGKSAEHQLEASVADHPLLAIGLAASAGLLVGAMSRR